MQVEGSFADAASFDSQGDGIKPAQFTGHHEAQERGRSGTHQAARHKFIIRHTMVPRLAPAPVLFRLSIEGRRYSTMRWSAIGRSF